MQFPFINRNPFEDPKFRAHIHPQALLVFFTPFHRHPPLIVIHQNASNSYLGMPLVTEYGNYRVPLYNHHLKLEPYFRKIQKNPGVIFLKVSP